MDCSVLLPSKGLPTNTREIPYSQKNTAANDLRTRLRHLVGPVDCSVLLQTKESLPYRAACVVSVEIGTRRTRQFCGRNSKFSNSADVRACEDRISTGDHQPDFTHAPPVATVGRCFVFPCVVSRTPVSPASQ